MSDNGQPLIQITELTKVFYTDEIETHALSGVHLTITKASTSPCRARRAAASRRCCRSSVCSTRRPAALHAEQQAG